MNNFINKLEEVNKKILEAIENKEDLHELLKKREDIIYSLEEIREDKDIIKALYYERGLHIQDKEIKVKMSNMLMEIREEIKEVQIRKNANRGYSNSVRRENIYSRFV